MKKTAIMGFGNPCRSDDGVGCYVIDQLKALDLPETVQLFDMGTSAFEVLFQLQGHERIVIVDAVVHSGEATGTLFRLLASEVNAAIQDDPMVFLHSLKWDQALSYAKKILGDQYPEDIEVWLVAVENTRLEMGLCPAVQAAGNRAAQLIADTLKVSTEY